MRIKSSEFPSSFHLITRPYVESLNCVEMQKAERKPESTIRGKQMFLRELRCKIVSAPNPNTVQGSGVPSCDILCRHSNDS